MLTIIYDFLATLLSIHSCHKNYSLVTRYPHITSYMVKLVLKMPHPNFARTISLYTYVAMYLACVKFVVSLWLRMYVSYCCLYIIVNYIIKLAYRLMEELDSLYGLCTYNNIM